jgi:hypothetical protein
MAIGQKVRVNVNGIMHRGRIVDMTAGEMQVAIMAGTSMPHMIWVAR